MSTYYEILNITSSASAEDIQSVCDEKYNSWRHLVTHNDPKVVEKANLALRTIEQIRSVLLDPIKKADYDASLNVGGLADPEAILRVSGPVMTPPSPLSKKRHDVVSPSVANKPGLWTCVKCKTDNPPQTLYCFNCGTQLVRECPECNRISSLISTGICGNCGYGYEIAQRHQSFLREKAEINQKIRSLQRTLADINLVKTFPKKTVYFGILLIIIGYFLAPIMPDDLGVVRNHFNIASVIGVILIIIGFAINKSNTEKKNAVVYNTSEEIDEKQQKLRQIVLEIRNIEENKIGR